QLKVEIQSPDGKPIKGFEMANATTLVGDAIDETAAWKKKPSLAALAGKPVRLRFMMQEADLFALQFTV
ncbi:MAG: hypothetical protein ACKO85_09765, partial [Isosphaeraceae bacterium]